MNLKKILRIAIIIEWASILVNIIVSELLTTSLPQELQNYLQWELEQDLTFTEQILLPTFTLLFLAYIISSIGLFLFKPWAKKAYVIVSILGFMALIFTGPMVEHALTTALGEIESSAFGFILALLFFTNVYESGEITA